MQLQCRSCSTCAAGFSIAKRVKIIVEGRTFYISFYTSYFNSFNFTSFNFKQTDVYYTLGQPSRNATPGAGKKLGKVFGPKI